VTAAALLAVVAGSLVGWWRTHERIPRAIRVATAETGGLYHYVGALLKPRLEEITGRPVELVVTRGTVDNSTRLFAGDADLAIMQSGAASPASHIRVLAPLYSEPVHVVVRRTADIQSVLELRDRRIGVGPQGSGMRTSALQILEHYRLTGADMSGDYFRGLREKPELDAAIVTTGMLNPDLRALLASGDFRLLPILDAEALALLRPHFHTITVPRGLYGEDPPVPEKNVLMIPVDTHCHVPISV